MPRGSAKGIQKIINLAPHPVRMLSDEPGEPSVNFPKCDNPPRVEISQRDSEYGHHVTALGTVKLFVLDHGAVQNMPAPKPGTLYIVSRMIADALPDRTDLAVPTNIVRRDSDKKVVGNLSLAVRQ